jgi:type I restriction enzyme S subunit
MKINWQTRKLGEVCVIGTGNSAPQKKEFFINGKYPFFRTSDVGNVKISKSLNRVSDYLNEKGIKNLRLFKKGTILLPKSGASTFLNHRVIMGVDGFVASHLATIKSNDKFLNRDFLFYFLQEIRAQDLIQDHKYPSLNLSIIKEIEIALPPLAEQKRIVKVLDEVFEGIKLAKENTAKNLRNSKELFESYLQGVFANPGKDWEEKTLAEISLEFGRGKSKHRPRNDKKLYGGEYPFIQTGDIRNSDHFIKEYTQTYNKNGLAQSKLWARGTICITIAANIAETGILDFDACFPDSVIGLVVNPKKADKSFIEYVLQFFKKKLQAKGKGSAQDNLNMAKFENEYFPIPPLKEQKSIVAKLDALAAETGKLVGIYKQKLADLDELKKSMLKKAFNGEL